MLELKNIEVFYGDAQALWSVSFRVEQGEIVTLLGSNGSGKTTTLKTISGLYRPRKGSILFSGERIDEVPPYEIVKRGIAHVPEGRGLFPNMEVVENLMMGAYAPHAWMERSETIGRVFSLFPILKERSHQVAGTLSGGEQQMLSIGRGLMTKPKLLMLDEPSLGLAPIIVDHIFETVRNVKTQGVTILLNEQNANLALQCADRAYVLETGKIALSGTACDMLENPYIKKAYLGLGEET